MAAEKIKPKDHLYRYHQKHLYKHSIPRRILFYLLSFLILIITIELISSGFHPQIASEWHAIFYQVPLTTVLVDGLFSFTRLLIAYIAVVIVTFFALVIINSHSNIENFLVPIFDILQSVPVLAFFPLIIIAFARLHLPELAAQIVLFVAMLWPLLFGAIGGLHQIPEEILEAASVYQATGIKKFTKIIIPGIVPNIVTGSILSWGSAWNVIIISEFINYGTIHIRLPGLGNLLSSSAGNNNGTFIVSLIILVLIITIVNRVVWNPLLNFSERFKFE